jgi:hypothetical protein
MRIFNFINKIFGKKTTDIETLANGIFIDFYNQELFDRKMARPEAERAAYKIIRGAWGLNRISGPPGYSGPPPPDNPDRKRRWFYGREAPCLPPGIRPATPIQ